MNYTNYFSLIVHFDIYIRGFISLYHNYFYLVLFLIIFAETGFIFFPFLPGDSLLFVSGSLVSSSNLNLYFIAIIIILAAFLGDNVNYFIGKTVGFTFLNKRNSKFINKKFLIKTHDYYELYGTKTVILARLIPIVRSFAPFVAGIGRMNYIYFLIFSFFGSAIWVTLFFGGGYILGGIPIIYNHLSLIMFFILILSLVPVVKMVLNQIKK